MTASYLVLSLELVQTAPRKLSSTPRGGERGWLAYIMYFLNHFHGWRGWTLEEEALLYILLVSLQFEEKEDQGFADIIGILVDSCVDGVFSYCNCKCVYVFHLFLYCSLLNK